MAEARQLLGVIGIALGCAVALAATHTLTAARIHENESAAARRLVGGLLPVAAKIPLPDLDRPPAAWDYCGGHLLARSDARGYGGPIRLLYVLDAEPGPAGDGTAYTLGRVALLGHQETPGITDFLDDPAWLEQLSGASAAGIESVDTVSGATITSRALTDALASAVRDPAAVLGDPQPTGCDP